MLEIKSASCDCCSDGSDGFVDDDDGVWVIVQSKREMAG